MYLLAGRETDEGMWLVHRLHGCTGDPSSLHPGKSQGHRADKARPSLIQDSSNGSCPIASRLPTSSLFPLGIIIEVSLGQ